MAEAILSRQTLVTFEGFSLLMDSKTEAAHVGFGDHLFSTPIEFSFGAKQKK